jgi:hypothetical protein
LAWLLLTPDSRAEESELDNESAECAMPPGPTGVGIRGVEWHDL